MLKFLGNPLNSDYKLEEKLGGCPPTEGPFLLLFPILSTIKCSCKRGLYTESQTTHQLTKLGASHPGTHPSHEAELGTGLAVDSALFSESKSTYFYPSTASHGLVCAQQCYSSFMALASRKYMGFSGKTNDGRAQALVHPV